MNVYHLSIHKTGSTWFRLLAEHPVFRLASGLEPYVHFAPQNYGEDRRHVSERIYSNPVPENTFVAQFFVDITGFAQLPKYKGWKSFVMIRHPLDMLVSYYFSIMYSHGPAGQVGEIRRELTASDEKQQWKRCVSIMGSSYTAMRNFFEFDHPDHKVFRFEEFFSNLPNGLDVLLDHIGVEMSDADRVTILNDLSFKTLSEGRQVGEEDQSSHWRKGTSNDWQEYLKPYVLTEFNRLYKGLFEGMYNLN